MQNIYMIFICALILLFFLYISSKYSESKLQILARGDDHIYEHIHSQILKDINLSNKVNDTTLDFRVFIVVHKNRQLLYELLASIDKSDINQYSHEIVVINNYGALKLKSPVIRVIDNQARPDFSFGHLARDWNAALINGFQDLLIPKSRVVVALQGDTKVKGNFATQLWSYHKEEGLVLVQSGAGDEAISYTADAVKNIGIWDEHFCSIHFQAADYLLRAVISVPDRVSISDYLHSRVHNPREPFTQKATTGQMRGERIDYHLALGHLNRDYFSLKWGDLRPSAWPVNCSLLWHDRKPAVLQHFYYPYFEKDIENLEGYGLADRSPDVESDLDRSTPSSF